MTEQELLEQMLNENNEYLKLTDFSDENKATESNVKKWLDSGYQILILGHARSGKTFLMKNIWQNVFDKKMFLTHTHACRYKFLEQVGYKNIFDTTVFAAIEVDKSLINREWKFIDEIGLFSNNQFNAAAWFAQIEGNVIMTADVHQLINSDFLHTVIMTAFKNKVNNLKEYNQLYVLKDELKISEKSVEKFNSNLKHKKIKILYADYKQNRVIMDDFEKNGLKNFIVDDNSIEFLKSEIEQGVQIITPCVQDRDLLINSISPNWVKNLTVGERVYCKKNEFTNRNRRKWWNGVYYTVSSIDDYYVSLKKEYTDDNEHFNSLDITVNKAIFSEYFQPPHTICVAKGQGSDFKDVILYINEKSASCLNFNLCYCAASRAKNTFKVVVADKSLLSQIEVNEQVVKDLTNIHQKVDTIKIKECISSFAYEFNRSQTLTYHTVHNIDFKNVITYKQLHELFNKKYNLNITYNQFKYFSKDVTFNNLEQPKKCKKNLDLLNQVLMALKNGTTPYSSNRYIKQVASKIDYKNSNVKTEPDWEKFKKIELAEIWYITYYSLGLYLQTLNDKLTFNDYFALISLRLCFDEELTSAWDANRDKYERNLQNAIDNYTSFNNTTASKIEHTSEPKHKKNYQYQGEISGRYSPVFNKSNTLPTSQDWLTEPVVGQLNAYNLYNTELCVIDIDNYVPNIVKTRENGETYEIETMKEFIGFFESVGAPIFWKTCDDERHKYSCHIWFRSNFKAPRLYCKFGEILTGAHSQNVYLKSNKYPENFKVSDIEDLLPNYSAFTLNSALELLDLYKDDSVKVTDYEVSEDEYVNYCLHRKVNKITDEQLKRELLNKSRNLYKQHENFIKSNMNIVDYLKLTNNLSIAQQKIEVNKKPRNYYDDDYCDAEDAEYNYNDE